MSKNNSTTPPPSPADRPITTTAAAVTLHEWKWSTAWIPSSFYLDSADQTRPVGPRGVLHGSLPSPAPFKSNVSAPAGIITTSRLIHRSRRHHICIVVSGEGGFGKAPSDLHEECQFVTRAVVFWNFPALYKACADWSIAAGGKSFCDMWLVEDWNGNYDQIISNWRAWDLWQLMKKLPFFVGVQREGMAKLKGIRNHVFFFVWCKWGGLS